MRDAARLDLVRIHERAEMGVWKECIAAVTPADVVRLGLSIVPVGDGMALVATRIPTLFYNRAFGFGLDRPVREDEIAAAIGLYRRDAPFSIQPTPLAAPPAVHTWLDSRGLFAHVSWVCWIRETGRARKVENPRTDFGIDTIAPGAADEFGTLTARIFGKPPDMMPWGVRTVGREGWTHYVALDGGRPVAVGALFCSDGVGWLGWGGTLESHRGRGAQSALIARRIRDAGKRGCRWVTVETAEDLPGRPSPSYRNMARAGFEIACLRPSHAHFPPPAEPPTE